MATRDQKHYIYNCTSNIPHTHTHTICVEDAINLVVRSSPWRSINRSDCSYVITCSVNARCSAIIARISCAQFAFNSHYWYTYTYTYVYVNIHRSEQTHIQTENTSTNDCANDCARAMPSKQSSHIPPAHNIITAKRQ